MTRTLTCTLGAIALAASIASAQAAGGGAQSTTTPRGNTGSQTNTEPQGNTNQRQAGQTKTYTGCLQGSAAGGYTLMTIGGNSAANQPAGAASSASSAKNTGTMTYSVMPGTSTTDMSTMANQRVEIVGTVANPHGAASTTRSGSDTPSSTAGAGSPASPTGQAPAEGAANTTPRSGAGASTSGGAHAGMSSGNAAHQTLTVTSIRVVPGGCTQ